MSKPRAFSRENPEFRAIIRQQSQQPVKTRSKIPSVLKRKSGQYITTSITVGKPKRGHSP
jgi:hypothetical protein